MAAANETSADAATVALLTELDGIFTSKEEPKNATEGFP